MLYYNLQTKKSPLWKYQQRRENIIQQIGPQARIEHKQKFSSCPNFKKIEVKTTNKKQKNCYLGAYSFGQVTSVKVPVGLQRNRTQIQKVRDQGQT